MRLEEFLKEKYPTRFADGVRSVSDTDDYVEIMANGGETLYLTKQFLFNEGIIVNRNEKQG